MDTIGFMELSSIAAGVEVADAMLKSGQIDLIYAKASCPGKYYILVSGLVSAVANSMKHASELGGGFVVNSIQISKVHPDVIRAISMAAMPDKIKAIGVMEFYSVASAIIAADTSVKSSNVQIVDLRLGTGIGGKSFVILTGETASVISAVDAGCKSQSESGLLVNKTVIANPKKELIESLL